MNERSGEKIMGVSATTFKVLTRIVFEKSSLATTIASRRLPARPGFQPFYDGG